MKKDLTSYLVTCDASMPLEKIHQELESDGFTLGYVPEGKYSKKKPLLHFLNDRIPNIKALKYGGIEDICVSLKINADGKTFTTHNVPRSATGPDFKKIMIGGRGLYGEILEATLRFCPLPEATEKLKFSWKKKIDRENFIKKLHSSGVRPAALEILSPLSLTISLEGTSAQVAAEKKCSESFY